MKLSDVKIRALKPSAHKDQWINDCAGLYLRVRRRSKNFVLRRKLNGKTKIVTLGPWRDPRAIAPNPRALSLRNDWIFYRMTTTATQAWLRRKAGDRYYAIKALSICLDHDLPVSKWIAVALGPGLRVWVSFEVSLLDRAFHLPPRTPGKLKKMKRMTWRRAFKTDWPRLHAPSRSG